MQSLFFVSLLPRLTAVLQFWSYWIQQLTFLKVLPGEQPRLKPGPTGADISGLLSPHWAQSCVCGRILPLIKAGTVQPAL